mmetsp:Transcript_37913/g.76042  ORF Transcript_37913/g.76042 Transcript_37913/m.76042 type:complete len:233 (-) Transcript_37913:1218-1916(-)
MPIWECGVAPLRARSRPPTVSWRRSTTLTRTRTRMRRRASRRSRRRRRPSVTPTSVGCTICTAPTTRACSSSRTSSSSTFGSRRSSSTPSAAAVAAARRAPPSSRPPCTSRPSRTETSSRRAPTAGFCNSITTGQTRAKTLPNDGRRSRASSPRWSASRGSISTRTLASFSASAPLCAAGRQPFSWSATRLRLCSSPRAPTARCRLRAFGEGTRPLPSMCTSGSSARCRPAV